MIHLAQRLDLSGLPFQIYVTFVAPDGELKECAMMLYLEGMAVPEAMDRLIGDANVIKAAYERAVNPKTAEDIVRECAEEVGVDPEDIMRDCAVADVLDECAYAEVLGE